MGAGQHASRCLRPGYGVRLEPGSRIIMQVHYNLLDRRRARRVGRAPPRRPGHSQDLTPVQGTMLPAPVELPCRKGHTDNPLCDRDAAMVDVIDRVGGAGNTNNALYLLCGGKPKASNTTSCDRHIWRADHDPWRRRPHAPARPVDQDRGQPRARPRPRPIIDIPIWDFDNQGTKPIKPVTLDYGDVVRVTCRHVQWLRDKLPSFEGIPDKYVVWGEGTTDEMCLGIPHGHASLST